MKYKAIIFDLYGTLVDFTNEDYVEQLCKMSCVLGIDKDVFTHYWNIDTYEQRMLGGYPTAADNLKEICSRVNIDTDCSSIMKAANISLEYTSKSLSQLRNNVENTLNELKIRSTR